MGAKQSIKEKLMMVLLPPLAALLIRAIGALVRIDIIGSEKIQHFRNEQKGLIFAAWHDQLLLIPHWYSGPGATVLISPSKDGELIARTVSWFGLKAVRGSSSRGGREALRSLVTLGKEKYDLAITPDGPKGPRHRIKAGVVQMARLTGRPVIPLALVCSRGYRFNSWDRFLLPLPFSKAVLSYGDVVEYDNSETFEELQDRIQEAMDLNLERACSSLEKKGASAI